MLDRTKVGDTINVKDLVNDGFVPHRRVYDGKNFTFIDDDKIDYYSTASPNNLTVHFLHPDGREIVYGLYHVGKPPGFISKNYCKMLYYANMGDIKKRR